ncbi:transcriptional regulator [Arenicella chitinivorans]|uniref:Transcriptional regulator n=2 Tax=Arenicella chitinivorans TaxID=1329800 RepID=A0A918RZG3_9GAMM|nr:transcriptional regulator [Arenicella chitinivorans]
MQPVADQVSSVLKSISSPKRLLVLCQLAEGERCVGELSAALSMTSPAMSQQLSILRREGIVETRRDGQVVYYSIKDENVLAIMALLYQRYCAPAHN